MGRKDQVLQFWTKQEADIYSMYLNKGADYLNAHEKNEMIALLPDLKGKNIVDLASGIGRFTRHFSTQGKKVISVEIAPHFMEKNRGDHSECKNVTYICSDVMQLEMEKSSCDFVFMNWLFMYLEDEETKTLLDKIHQWLTPNGELFFRESCNFKYLSIKEDYYVHYRTLFYYDSLIKEKFTLIKEGHLQTYVDYLGNPFQCYWHCRKS